MELFQVTCRDCEFQSAILDEDDVMNEGIMHAIVTDHAILIEEI